MNEVTLILKNYRAHNSNSARTGSKIQLKFKILSLKQVMDATALELINMLSNQQKKYFFE